eukprot:1354494-Amphidinium_carterae.1
MVPLINTSNSTFRSAVVDKVQKRKQNKINKPAITQSIWADGAHNVLESNMYHQTDQIRVLLYDPKAFQN